MINGEQKVGMILKHDRGRPKGFQFVLEMPHADTVAQRHVLSDQDIRAIAKLK